MKQIIIVLLIFGCNIAYSQIEYKVEKGKSITIQLKENPQKIKLRIIDTASFTKGFKIQSNYLDTLSNKSVAAKLFEKTDKFIKTVEDSIFNNRDTLIAFFEKNEISKIDSTYSNYISPILFDFKIQKENGTLGIKANKNDIISITDMREIEVEYNKENSKVDTLTISHGNTSIIITNQNLAKESSNVLLYIILFIVIVAIIAGVWYFLKKNDKDKTPVPEVPVQIENPIIESPKNSDNNSNEINQLVTGLLELKDDLIKAEEGKRLARGKQQQQVFLAKIRSTKGKIRTTRQNLYQKIKVEISRLYEESNFQKIRNFIHLLEEHDFEKNPKIKKRKEELKNKEEEELKEKQTEKTSGSIETSMPLSVISEEQPEKVIPHNKENSIELDNENENESNTPDEQGKSIKEASDEVTGSNTPEVKKEQPNEIIEPKSPVSPDTTEEIPSDALKKETAIEEASDEVTSSNTPEVKKEQPNEIIEPKSPVSPDTEEKVLDDASDKQTVTEEGKNLNKEEEKIDLVTDDKANISKTELDELKNKITNLENSVSNKDNSHEAEKKALENEFNKFKKDNKDKIAIANVIHSKLSKKKSNELGKEIENLLATKNELEEVKTKILTPLGIKGINTEQIKGYLKTKEIVSAISTKLSLEEANIGNIYEKVAAHVDMLNEEIVDLTKNNTFIEKSVLAELGLIGKLEKELKEIVNSFKTSKEETDSLRSTLSSKGFDNLKDKGLNEIVVEYLNTIEREVFNKLGIKETQPYGKIDAVKTSLEAYKKVEKRIASLKETLNEEKTNIKQYIQATNKHLLKDESEDNKYIKEVNRNESLISKFNKLKSPLGFENDSFWYLKVEQAVKQKLREITTLEAEKQGILNSFGIVSVDDVDDIKNNISKLEEIKSKLGVREVSDILGKIKSIQSDGDKVKEGIRSEYSGKIDMLEQTVKEQQNIVENYKNNVLIPLGVAGLEDKTTIQKYLAYSNFFGNQTFEEVTYAHSIYNQIKGNHKYKVLVNDFDRVINQSEVAYFIKNLTVYLKYLKINLNDFKSNTSRYKEDFAILDTSYIDRTLEKLENLALLRKVSDNLLDISKKAFFSQFIMPNLKTLINNLSALYAYSNIKNVDKLEIVSAFNEDEKLRIEFQAIFESLAKFLLVEYDIRLVVPNLLTDIFSSKDHEMIEYSYVKSFPKFSKHIEHLSHGVIYDVYEVGMTSNLLSISNKPKVVYKH